MTPKQEQALQAAEAALIAIDASRTAIAEAVRVLRASLADPVPAPPPPPVEPPAPPAPTGLIRTHGNLGNWKGRTHTYADVDLVTGEVLGPFDYIDPAKMLPPIPWRIAPPPSCKGVEPKAWDKWDIYGSTGGLYSATPAIVDGKMVPIYTQFGNEIVPGVMPHLKNHPQRPGPRGVNISHPYITWHGHDHRDDAGAVVKSPHMPAWIGIGLDSVLHYAMYDGAINAPYKVKSLAGDYCHDFCYFEPDRKRFFVTGTGKGTLIEINRPVTSDPSTWTERVVADGLGTASSVRCTGSMLYVADSKNGLLVEVHPDTGAKRTVASIHGAFWVDRFSNGDLCVATNSGQVSRVSTAGVVTFLFRVGANHRWITCSVDREGTCGEVDTVLVIHMIGSNVDFWRWRPSSGKVTNGFGVSQGVATVGNVLKTQDVTGHYPWVAEYHPIYAMMLVQGTSNPQPGVIAARANSVVNDPYDHFLYNKGRLVIFNGGTLSPVANGDYRTTPSFTAFMAFQGGSYVGCSLEHIGEMPPAKAAAFVRSGMIGTTPRPVAPDAMRALLYAAWLGTQTYLLEGKPFLDRQFAALTAAGG